MQIFSRDKSEQIRVKSEKIVFGNLDHRPKKALSIESKKETGVNNVPEKSSSNNQKRVKQSRVFLCDHFK